MKCVEGAADKPLRRLHESGQVGHPSPVAVPGSDLRLAVIANERHRLSTGRGLPRRGSHEGARRFKGDLDDPWVTATIRQGRPIVAAQTVTRSCQYPRWNVITALSMQAAIITNGEAQHRGNFPPPRSLRERYNQLQPGLPANPEAESEQQISATIGTDHLTKLVCGRPFIGFLLVIST